MSQLIKFVLLNNLKKSLEQKLIDNINIINNTWDDIDLCNNKIEEGFLIDLINIHETENIKIYKILYDINI